jgi:hypothetical protein
MTAVSRAQQHSRLGCRAVEQPWQESPTSRSRRRTDAERGDERAAQRSRRPACTARRRTGLPARRAARELAARQSCSLLAAAASVGTASTAPQPTGLRQTAGAPARPDWVRTHSLCRSPTSVTGPGSSCSSSRRRSPCCCLRPCAHPAHRHTPNRKIETLRGGVDPVSRTSDGLRRPAAKGSCLSCREPVPPLRRSSVVRRSSRPSPYLWRCLGYQECPSVQEFLADDEPAPVRTPDPRSRVARWLLRAVGHWDFVWDFVRIRGAEPLASDD